MNITHLRRMTKANVDALKAEFKLSKNNIPAILASAKRKFGNYESDTNLYEWEDRNLSSDSNYNGNFDDMSAELGKWATEVIADFRLTVGNMIELDIDVSDIYGLIQIAVLPELRDIKKLLWSKCKETMFSNETIFGAISVRGLGDNGMGIKDDDKIEIHTKRIISFAKIYGITIEVKKYSDCRYPAIIVI